MCILYEGHLGILVDQISADHCIGKTGINFTNILRAAFVCAEPKSAKDTDDLIVFCAFGSALLKAVCFVVSFINVLQAAFACADPKSVKNTVKSSVFFYAFVI